MRVYGAGRKQLIERHARINGLFFAVYRDVHAQFPGAVGRQSDGNAKKQDFRKT